MNFAPPARRASEPHGSGSQGLLLRVEADATAAGGEEAANSTRPLLAPRCPEKERLLKVDLPEAERCAEAQLLTCLALGQVAGTVAEVLSGAGAGVQREVAAANVCGLSLEARLQMDDQRVAKA